MSDSLDPHGRFLALHEDLIRAFARKYGSARYPIDADDLVQETKIRLWKVLENGRDIEFIAAYVRKVVDSVIMEHLEQMNRERTVLQTEQVRIFSESHFQSRRAHPNLTDVVREALPRLTAARRSVLQLTISGLSIREIASLQGWSIKKTYHLYERGLRDLRKTLAEEGCLS
jgi:RNA polymerase sigma factor (sigma-70 family)